MGSKNISGISLKIIDTIIQNKMMDGVSKVYVATSGGADSMALLAYLNDKKGLFKIDIGAVHVNHGIRGETANRDAKFVEDYCKKNDIEFILFDANTDGVDVPENASEEWARRLRYNYFEKLCIPGVRIATAHTLSDQTETILFRLARGGSGLNGLAGIPVTRGYFIRPFININRSEVEQMVDYYGTSNITDETNLGDDYSRNKIRHHVVPVLKEINDKAEQSFGKFCDRMSKAYKFVSDSAKGKLASAEIIEGYKYDITEFLGEYEIVTEEMISQLLSKVGFLNEGFVDFIAKCIYEVKQSNSINEKYIGGTRLSDTKTISVTTRYIEIIDDMKNVIDNNISENAGHYHFANKFGYGLDIDKISYSDFEKNCKSKYELCHYADLDKLDISKCTLRYRVTGDKFKPACKTSGKISKFMKDIPILEKDMIPVIEYNGKVIWVWGVGFTDGFTPKDNKKNNVIYIRSIDNRKVM